MVVNLTCKIKLQPKIIPTTRAINIGPNRKLPIPFWIYICKILVIRTGIHKSIIDEVGGRKKVIMGTENKDKPMPTAPLITAPKKTAIKITIITSIS